CSYHCTELTRSLAGSSWGRVEVRADLAEPAGVVAGGQGAGDQAGQDGAVAVVVLAAGLSGDHRRLAGPGAFEGAQRGIDVGWLLGGGAERDGERPGVLQGLVGTLGPGGREGVRRVADDRDPAASPGPRHWVPDVREEAGLVVGDGREDFAHGGCPVGEVLAEHGE